MTLRNYILRLAEKVLDADDDYKKKSMVKKKKEVERERPDNNRDLYWDIYRTDAIVGALTDFKISFVLGAGMKVAIFDENGAEVNVPEFNQILRRSKPRSIMSQFLKDSSVSGDGYIEKMFSGDGGAKITRFDVIPTDEMVINRDGFGKVESYVQELGESENDYPVFEPTQVVHYRNRAVSGEAYGRSDIEPITEVSEILRDMIIDLSNFISTKAYPPLLWKLGTKEQPWGKADIDAFALERADVEPGDQIVVRGDVDGIAVGVAGQTLDINPYLTFFASLIVSGLRSPSTLTSVISNVGQFTADSQTNAYARMINDIRADLAELLEVELFDYIIHFNGYGENYRSKVTWEKHDDESLRLAVNNIIQLVQNGIISPVEGRLDLNYPTKVNGELRVAVDNAENDTPNIPNESDQNNMEQTLDGDERTGQVRKTATDET